MQIIQFNVAAGIAASRWIVTEACGLGTHDQELSGAATWTGDRHHHHLRTQSLSPLETHLCCIQFLLTYAIDSRKDLLLWEIYDATTTLRQRPTDRKGETAPKPQTAVTTQDQPQIGRDRLHRTGTAQTALTAPNHQSTAVWDLRRCGRDQQHRKGESAPNLKLLSRPKINHKTVRDRLHRTGCTYCTKPPVLHSTFSLP